MCHSSFWPAEGIDYKGKKVAVIGTGASGVQMIQEIGPAAEKLDVYQRTPNLALPMGRRDLTKEEQDQLKPLYPAILAYRERCFAGFHYDLCERNTFDDTPEEREKFFDQIWEQAGFALWLGGYKDYLFDDKSNDEAYKCWRKRQMGRVKNSEKQRILFPEKKPHPFGVKRPCLEQNYYEVLDRDNVEIIDINEKSGTPITDFTKNGIKTSEGKEREYDIIALATGFDVVTGGMTSMGLQSIHGTYLKDEWKEGAHTYLGTTIAGYPNMFHLYGPHGPTLLSNGPSSVEVQGRWIRDAINLANRQGVKYVNPKREASDAWKRRINELGDATLFPTTRSTYMGGKFRVSECLDPSADCSLGTVPGKKNEMTCYAGGVGAYHDEIRKALTGWQGFEVVAA
jgi:cation diffusion facilitator CzcD-associated flavoprotein CzcO